MIEIIHRTVVLSDGSEVHNVLVSEDTASGWAEFHCVTEDDAIAFAAALVSAIQRHTVDEASRTSDREVA